MSTEFEKPIDLREWPAGAEPDGREYRLAWTTNQRALMQNLDQHPDNFQPDAEGAIQWLPVDPDPRMVELPESLSNAIDGKVGSYVAMSKLAVHLNKLQEGAAYQYRSFTFYPDPLEEVRAA